MRPTALLFPLAALTGLGLAVPIETPLDPTDIVDTLSDLTAVCEDLMGPASQINVVTAPLLLFGAGPLEEIRKGFEYIASILDELVAQRPPTAPFTASEARAVTDGFQTYADAQTGLLDVVAQAGRVADMVPAVGPEIRAVLEGTTGSVNRFVDTLAASLGDKLAGGIVSTVAPLAVSLTQAVSAFI